MFGVFNKTKNSPNLHDLGGYNSFMLGKTSGLYSCKKLPAQDEASLVDTFLAAMKYRPGDMQTDKYRVLDAKSGISVWISNGEEWVMFNEASGNSLPRVILREKSQKRLWSAYQKLLSNRDAAAKRAANPEFLDPKDFQFLLHKILGSMPSNISVLRED